MTEQELIHLCKKNDRRAQKLLYEKYFASMTRLCTRYIKNPDDVKDTLTEGFLKVFNKLPDFEYRGDGGLEGWMRRIMVNESLMFLRRSRQLVFIDIEEIPFEPECELSQSLEAEEILKMIEELPAGYRTIFNLYAIEGFSHKEIGDLLGISESASRSQLTHARARLRNNFKDLKI